MFLQDLLNEFNDLYVLSGKGGLNKKVSGVTVMDAPDIYKWMKGEEFLITSGYPISISNVNLNDLIIKLNDANTSALGIKMNRFLSVLPQEVINLSNEINFPIIFIPNHYSFSEIINPSMKVLLDCKTAKLEKSELIHKTFTKLAVNGEGTEKIINMLGNMLNIGTAYIDVLFNKIYFSCNVADDGFKSLVHDIMNKSNYQCINCCPVAIGSIIYGYIICDTAGNKDYGEIEKTTIEHATTVLKIDIQKKLSNSKIEQKYRDEFLLDLLVNNISTLEEVTARAKRYHWKFEKKFACIIFDIDKYKEKLSLVNDEDSIINERNKMFEIAKINLRNSKYRFYYTNFSDMLICIVEFSYSTNEEEKHLELILEKVNKEIKTKSSLSFTTGVGEIKDSIIDIHISFTEAQQAIKLSRSINNINKISFYSRLGIYNLLFDLSCSKDVDSIYKKYIDTLINYDRDNNTDYYKTLFVIIEHDWNLKASSIALHVHYNTVKYRFNKISNLLNLNLTDRESKFILEFCFKLSQIK